MTDQNTENRNTEEKKKIGRPRIQRTEEEWKAETERRKKQKYARQKQKRTEEQKKRKTARVIDLTPQKIQKIEDHAISKALQRYELIGDDTENDIRRFVAQSLHWFGRTTARTAEEAQQRLQEYFTRVMDTGEKPSVENMCLALGADTRLVWKWENAGDQRGEVSKKGKQIIAALDAALADAGKIPQVVYIFRAKNFFGMKDQQQIAIQAQSVQTQSVQSLRDKYGDNAIQIDP